MFLSATVSISECIHCNVTHVDTHNSRLAGWNTPHAFYVENQDPGIKTLPFSQGCKNTKCSLECSPALGT